MKDEVKQLKKQTDDLLEQVAQRQAGSKGRCTKEDEASWVGDNCVPNSPEEEKKKPKKTNQMSQSIFSKRSKK